MTVRAPLLKKITLAFFTRLTYVPWFKLLFSFLEVESGNDGSGDSSGDNSGDGDGDMDDYDLNMEVHVNIINENSVSTPLHAFLPSG